MNNPGLYTLATVSITTALTASAQTAIDDLDGMSGIMLECSVLGASGGSTIKAWVQTSLDGGTTWRDVALFEFTTSAVTKWCVLSKATKSIASYAALASEGVNDGYFGDRLRAVLTTTGTYSNTTLALRAHVT